MPAYPAAGGPADRGGDFAPTFRPGAWLRKQGAAGADGALSPSRTALLEVPHLTDTSRTAAAPPPRNTTRKGSTKADNRDDERVPLALYRHADGELMMPSPT
ncbi:hypothetical protein ACFXI0_08420 [Kitasatospora indigofera]|uniref:hypothetical protein n=1 Tax=Kitasatospora indigofera TaxID=67307 RepID=UPI0036B662F9